MNDKRKGETNYALVITIVVAFGMMLCMCGGCDPIGVCGWVMAGVGCLQIPMLSTSAGVRSIISIAR